MPTVSVLLPTCDRPHLLGRAVASVLAQTWPDFELIVVDNNRRTVLAERDPGLQRQLADPRVRVVRDTRSTNAAEARNEGLAVARGEWITYLDDDDAYRPEKLAEQLQLARRTGSPLVLCGYVVMLAGRQRIRQVDVTKYSGDALLLDATWGTPFLFHRATELRFDAAHVAGHDELLAHELIRHFDLREVPNCARAMVQVYPQVGRPRVHADFEAIWQAHRATARVVRGRYRAEALRQYLRRGLLVRAQGGLESWGRSLRLGAAMLCGRNGRDYRLVLNSLCYRIKPLRRFIVT